MSTRENIILPVKTINLPVKTVNLPAETRENFKFTGQIENLPQFAGQIKNLP